MKLTCFSLKMLECEALLNTEGGPLPWPPSLKGIMMTGTNQLLRDTPQHHNSGESVSANTTHHCIWMDARDTLHRDRHTTKIQGEASLDGV
jgi:hypothetical protein